LEPLGFNPEGYDHKGYLVLHHPEAGYISLARSIREQRMKSTMIEAKERLRIARTHHGQFLIWLYAKYDLRPGQTTLVQSLTKLVEEYLDQAGVQVDSKQLHAIYENVRRSLKSDDPTPGRRTSLWRLTMPSEPKLIKPFTRKRLLTPRASKGTPVPATAPVPVGGSETPFAARIGSSLSASAVDELRRALALPGDRELLALTHSTLTQLADHVEEEAQYVVSELRTLVSLMEV